MKDLFSETGEKILESLTFTETLYAFDFDGTLAPIVETPEAAQASIQTEELLEELASLASIAIVSGRSISDLKTRLKTPAHHLIGNHGIEGMGARQESVELAKKNCKQWSEQLKDNWGKLTDDAGVQIENKTYSIAIHYRRSRNKRKSKTELLELIQILKPTPRVIHGKCVLNLIPEGAPHKGVALIELLTSLNLKCAFYIGDDDTDEDVFSLPDSRIISTRVGRKSGSQAQFFINRQSEVNRLLRKLIAFHRRLKKA